MNHVQVRFQRNVQGSVQGTIQGSGPLSHLSKNVSDMMYVVIVSVIVITEIIMTIQWIRLHLTHISHCITLSQKIFFVCCSQEDVPDVT